MCNNTNTTEQFTPNDGIKNARQETYLQLHFCSDRLRLAVNQKLVSEFLKRVVTCFIHSASNQQLFHRVSLKIQGV